VRTKFLDTKIGSNFKKNHVELFSFSSMLA
jgi:hypothetical protein